MRLMDSSEMGKRGGKARAAGMTKQERSESARKAVAVRWANAKKAAAAGAKVAVKKGKKKD